MNLDTNIINKTLNGVICKCEDCKSYQIEFKNILFNLSYNDFDVFTNYIIELNNKNAYSEKFSSAFNRTIAIPTHNKSLYFILNHQELNELAFLFSFNKKDSTYNTEIKIDYNYSLS